MKSMGMLLRAARESANITVEQISEELETRGFKASSKKRYTVGKMVIANQLPRPSFICASDME